MMNKNDKLSKHKKNTAVHFIDNLIVYVGAVSFSAYRFSFSFIVETKNGFDLRINVLLPLTKTNLVQKNLEMEKNISGK